MATEDVPLRRYFERIVADAELRNQQRFEASEKAVTAALQAAKEAVAKAEVAAEKRFDAVNEFRGQLTDQAQTFMPRREYEVQHASLADKIEALTKIVNDRASRGVGATQAWGYLVGAVGMAALIVAALVAIHG